MYTMGWPEHGKPSPCPLTLPSGVTELTHKKCACLSQVDNLTVQLKLVFLAVLLPQLPEG